MKLSKDPLFICALLCICFPLGLIFLIKSDSKVKQKIIFSILGALLFCILIFLSMSNFKKPDNIPDYAITVSKNTLKVGESASLAIKDGDCYYSDIKIVAENDCLSLKGNVFTAEKIGKCNLTVYYGKQQDTIKINIIADNGANEPVYCSASGSKYHLNQAHGGKSAIKMSREDAEQSGKSPCKICYPSF